MGSWRRTDEMMTWSLREKQQKCLETQCLSASSSKQRKEKIKTKKETKEVTTNNVNPWCYVFSLINGHRFITIMLSSYDTLHLAEYYLTFQHVYACHVGNITSGLWFSQNYYYFCLVHFFSFLCHQLVPYLKYYSVSLSMVPLSDVGLE